MGFFAPLFPLLALFGYIFVLIINYGAIGGKWFGDLDVGEVSDIYNVSLTPSGWTFGIWGIIYTWQPIWIVYLIYLSFKAINRGRLYFNKLFWITYLLSCFLNCLWIAMWIMEEIEIAMVCLLLIWIVLILCGFSAHYWLVYEIPCALSQGASEDILDKYPQSLILSFQRGNNCCSERQLLYGFVLNGIPIYATWTTIAACINVSVVFRYTLELSNNGAVTVGLIILISNILVYWFCDFVKFNKYLRYTFTPYFVLIWAFFGVLTNYSMKDYDSSMVIFVLLIMAGVASVYKLFDSIRLIMKFNNQSGSDTANDTAAAPSIVSV